MAIFGNRRAAQAERELAQLRAALPVEAFQGKTVDSPFVETAPSRSLVPWRRGRTEVLEAAPVRQSAPARSGFLGDIPQGGSTEYNQGYTQIGGATDRRTLMEQMEQLYVGCQIARTCVDTIARTCTAGGMTIVPDDETNQRKEDVHLSAQAQKAQDLFDYVNPQQNFRQLLRKVITDLLIYGDSFVEVIWSLGEPVALYSLPCPDMLILADEHGDVNGYVQRTETNRRAPFKPHQVLHFKFDSPRSGLYGLGPTEGNIHPITTWLFTLGLLKHTMQKGNPPNMSIAWDIDLPDADIKKYSDQMRTRNMGAANVGNPWNLKGKTEIHEFHANAIAEYLAAMAVTRDQIVGGYGCYPAQVGIIESGNLGGGTGTSQFKSFKVNTCGPLEELVLEVFTFDILRQGFGVEDFRCDLEEIDWRDDAAIEEISHLRVTDGRWTINRGRDAIGEPPVEGGDDAVIIQTRDVVLVRDLAAMSEAGVEKAAGAVNPLAPIVPDTANDKPPEARPPTATPKASTKPAGHTAKADQQEPAHATGSPTEAVEEELLLEAFDGTFKSRWREAMATLPKAR